MNTHGLKIGFGRHEGELYTRVPCDYLKWMVNNKTRECEIAQAELDRRGIVTPEMDISGHAIDSASLRLLGPWTGTRKEGEGLYAWLCRNATEALGMGLNEEGQVVHNGIKFVFTMDGSWPVLKTVMPKRGQHESID